MRSILSPLTLGLATLLSAGAMAQQPYTWVISGLVVPCTPNTSVNIQTLPGTQPTININVPVDANCGFSATLNLASATSWIQVSTLCNGQMVSWSDSTMFNFFMDSTFTAITLTCETGNYDCLGVLNGPDMPGSACDDGDPNTTGDVWTGNCACVGTGGGAYDCLGVLNGPDMPGMACDDSNPLTTYSWWDANCVCTADSNFFNYDCLGILNGPNVPGSACVVPGTNITGTWDMNCVCDSLNNGNQYDCLGTLNGTALPGTVCTYTPDSGLTYLSGYWDVNCVCGDTAFWNTDCLGVLNGPDMPGTACDDGDPLTVQDHWTANCVCEGFLNGQIDCNGVLNGWDLPGTPCDDNDPLTAYSYWDWNCVCVADSSNGMLYDCLGVLNGPNMPGTACDDGDPMTFNDTWNGNCMCVGGGGLPCDATFVISQAYDSLQGQIPYALFVYTLNNAPGLSYVWDFGDGASSTQPYPVHSYNTPGPFLLCLTVTGFGCSDTYCDTIGIDSTGTIIPMGGQGGGFTINVMAAGSTSVDGPATTTEIFDIRPNPVLDVLTVDLHATSSASARIEVLDLTGKVVLAEQARWLAGANTLRMDVSRLETGAYLLRLSGPAGTITQRFVHGR